MNEKQLKRIKEHIPFMEKGIFNIEEGTTLLLEEEKNYNEGDEKKLPPEIRFYEMKEKKIIDSIGGLAFILMIGTILINENLKGNVSDDLTISTIVSSVALVVVLFIIVDKWWGDDSKRELIISKNGLNLNGKKYFKWENIQNIAIKKFPTGRSMSANFHLLIVDNENKIHEFDINGFKGKVNSGIINIRSSDYLELRNILWEYRKAHSTS